MDALHITGGVPLRGEVAISGAKNAVLPLMAASLLTDQPLVLTRIPVVADVRTLSKILGEFGVQSHLEAETHTLALHAKSIISFEASYDLVRTMRASFFTMGPLLARHGEAKVSLPGGCAIGTRPIDMHLYALERLGAQIELTEGYVHARSPQGLTGADITFEKVSVGATENAMMAATLARGTTRLMNAAREPEITDLAKCLSAMGAKISGAGTDTITIEGVAALHGATHAVVADRIEAGSFALAAAITGGDVLLRGVAPDLLGAVMERMQSTGIEIAPEGDGLRVRTAQGFRPSAVDISTAPFPAFPTDMQAQFMALLTMAEGASILRETIFENRFMHVPELVRMGADIAVDGHTAVIRGVPKLMAADVMATDLRASFSLVIAALAAHGTSRIHRLYHLDRGYERLEEKLQSLGARIARVAGDKAA